jgi:sensor histidine kinase regulating citrate/malate metabolism
MEEKTAKIEGKINKLAEGKSDYYKKRMADEAAKNAARAAAIVAKNSPVAEAVEADAAEEAPAVEEAPATEASAEETPAAE